MKKKRSVLRQKYNAIDKQGIRYKTWRTFLVFALVLIAILWVTQVLMINIFFSSMKIQKVISAGSEFADCYSEYGRDAEETKTFLRENSELTVYVFDEFGRVNFSNTSFDILRDDVNIKPKNVMEFIHQVDKSFNEQTPVRLYRGERFYLGTYENEDHVASVVYGERMESSGREVYVYVATNLNAEAGTIYVLARQLIIVSLVIIAASFMMSFVLANMLTEPLTDLTKTAARFAAGDHSVHFDGRGYTEIVELANTLNASNAELIKTDELRRDLIANVSHDLKTPLTLIKGNAEMIRDLTGDNKPKRDQQLSTIIEEVDRLTLLVSDILRLSKLQSGVIEYARERLNLSDVVTSALNSFSVLEGTEGFVFGGRIAPDVYVLGDTAKLEQVMYNLLSNAVSYSGESKNIEVSLTVNGGRARVSVRDHGYGMNDEVKRDIWIKYYRAERVRREVMGTGLGLNIVYNILKSAGAQFGVESALNEGSEFWFEIDID